MGNCLSDQVPQCCKFDSEDGGYQMICCEEREINRPKKATRQRGVDIPGFQRLFSPSVSYPNLNSGEDKTTDSKNEQTHSTQHDSKVSSDLSSHGPRSTPVWLRDPEPLPNWTVQEQSVLISQLRSRNNPIHLKSVFENTHRLVPNKTIEEIQLCYQHLQSKRIAFFGPSKTQVSSTNNRM